MQIDHDQICQLAFRQRITFVQVHRFGTAHGSHIEHIVGIQRGCVVQVQLLEGGSHKHLPEHIQAVVTGRPVRSDRQLDPHTHHPLKRSDSAGQLRIGRRVGHNEHVVVTEYFQIRLRHMHAVVTAAAVIKHP